MNNTWLSNFKPGMIVYDEGEATIVAAVCADRVFRVRYNMVLKTCKTERERDLMRKWMQRS